MRWTEMRYLADLFSSAVRRQKQLNKIVSSRDVCQCLVFFLGDIGFFSFVFEVDFAKNDTHGDDVMMRCICILIETSTMLISSLWILYIYSQYNEDDIRECSTSAWVGFDEDMEASEIIEEESLSPGTEQASK